MPAATASDVQIATLWPDAAVPTGWASMPWHVDPRAGRGWALPQQLAAGDVIEFAAHTAARRMHWYGVLDSYEFDRWLIVQGPYPDAVAAHHDAQCLLGLERLLPALDTPPEPGPEHESCEGATRLRRRCHR